MVVAKTFSIRTARYSELFYCSQLYFILSILSYNSTSTCFNIIKIFTIMLHLSPSMFKTKTWLLMTARFGTSFKGKYPSSMDLGDRFYDNLLDASTLEKRREENKKNYPPKEIFMKLLPAMSNADAYQFQQYWDGVYGELSKLPVDPDLLLKKFLDEADPDCVIWLMGRAGNRSTYKNNESDFENYRIVPRMLTGAHKADLSVSFQLGKEKFIWPTPFAIAPVGVQGRVTYPSSEGDLVAVRGATALDVPFVVSAVSSVSLEKIAETIKEINPKAPKPWFQLYNSNVPEISYSMLSRAKKSGYGAIVLTLDTIKYGFRTEELDAAYFPQADTRIQWSQMTWDPVFNAIMKQKFNAVASEEFSEHGKHPVDRLKTNMAVLSLVGCGLGDVWTKEERKHQPERANDNLEWFSQVIQKELELPLILKGILHPSDAVRAVQCGVDGIIVSNHGGRQVDGCISSIEALPAIVAAVNAECKVMKKKPIPVFLDSGVRYGQHVVKAVALGATGVLVGRMPIIGACLAQEEGVKHVLLNLLSDTHCTLINTGVERIQDLSTSNVIIRAPHAGAAPFSDGCAAAAAAGHTAGGKKPRKKRSVVSGAAPVVL